MVKKALILAKLLPGYLSIAEGIKAIVFMGTPHRGSRISSYMTPLSRIINGVSLASPIRADLLGSLKVLSQELSEISELAASQLSNIPIISFYEQKKMKGINNLVSQCLGLIHVRIGF